MTDYQTEKRQAELTSWERMSINRILGASTPVTLNDALGEIFAWLFGAAGIFLIVMVAGLVVGVYFGAAELGFNVGRGALRALLGMRG